MTSRDQLHEAAIRRAANTKGIEITLAGGAINLVGPDVDIRCLSFRDVSLADLQTARNVRIPMPVRAGRR